MLKLQHHSLPELLLKAGYKPGTNGYVKDLSIGTRFHWVVIDEDDWWMLHKDKTVNGKHKVVCPGNPSNEEKIEWKRIRSYAPPKPQGKKRKCEIAPNLREIVKIKTIVRKWYDPRRYLIGKFIYIKNG